MPALLACTLAAVLAQAHSSESFAVSKSQVKPGSSFDVVYTVNPEQGWHIYWENPGDTGQATKIDWKLPAGVTVDGPYLPAPEFLKDEAGITFIFAESVPAIYHITVPANYSGSKLSASGDVTYLVCKLQCLPISASFNFDINVGKSDVDSSDAASVALAKKSLPPLADPNTVTVAKAAKTVTISWKADQTQIPNPVFWPGNDATFVLEDQKWNYANGQWTTALKLQDGAEMPTELRGLLSNKGDKATALYVKKPIS